MYETACTKERKHYHLGFLSLQINNNYINNIITGNWREGHLSRKMSGPAGIEPRQNQGRMTSL